MIFRTALFALLTTCLCTGVSDLMLSTVTNTYAGSTLSAQRPDGPRRHGPNGGERFARVRAARQAFLTEELALTEREQQTFFPLYWEYQDRLRLAKRNAPAMMPPPMEEAEALAHLAKQRKHLTEALELRIKATQAFLEVLPAIKVIRLPELDKAFRKRLRDRVRRRE